MNIVDRAAADIARITGNNQEFGTGLPVVMTPPGGDPVSFTAIHTKHRRAVDPETGYSINAKVASIAVSESYLVAENYPVRNSTGEVFLQDHLVEVRDSTGVNCRYVVREWWPDEMIGLIVLILGDFE